MAKASNTINGKAFEFACLCALGHSITGNGASVITKQDEALENASRCFNSLDNNIRHNMLLAADTATKLLLPLEPKLVNGVGELVLSIANDSIAKGSDGDVRDVICTRPNDNWWTIGLSCKHNHEGLRHPRITDGKDFGADWIDMHCSEKFMAEIALITDPLNGNKERDIYWRSIRNKKDDYYVPILTAHLEEITRMCAMDSTVPARLLSYFFGAKDFYKVIMSPRDGTTTIEGFNMHGTLNRPYGSIRPMTKVPTTRMPTRLVDACFKPGSKTTILLYFDEGWTISMRLHNKDKFATPTSLAWEVYLEGLPRTLYINRHSWDEL